MYSKRKAKSKLNSKIVESLKGRSLSTYLFENQLKDKFTVIILKQ